MALRRKFRTMLRRLVRALLFLLLAGMASSAFYVLYLKWFPPFTTTVMVVRGWGTWQGQRPEIRAWWVGRKEISPAMARAVVAAEDDRFYQHYGFDFQAMRNAAAANLEGKRLRGGSTISQQVAKNVFLWHGRSYLRKGLEAWFTVLIETFWGKERILEMYMNIAETGNGLFGVEAAARHYYHKSAGQLNSHEAAMIATVLPSPRKLNPLKPTPAMQRKHSRVMAGMRHVGR